MYCSASAYSDYKDGSVQFVMLIPELNDLEGYTSTCKRLEEQILSNSTIKVTCKILFFIGLFIPI